MSSAAEIIELPRADDAALNGGVALMLHHFERFEVAIQQARQPKHLNEIIAQLDALVAYAKRHHGEYEELMTKARLAKLHAEQALGVMLRDMPKATGAKGVGPIAVPQENRNAPPTLAEMGIDKKTSMRAQRLADLSEDKVQDIAAGRISMKDAIVRNREREAAKASVPAPTYEEAIVRRCISMIRDGQIANELIDELAQAISEKRALSRPN